MAETRGAAAVRIARELTIVLVAALTYAGVRAITEEAVGDAVTNGRRLADFERALGIDWESAAQSLVIDHEWLVTLVNWVYIWGHWPVILSVGVFLYVRHRDAYRLLRNAMFISGLIGFLFFALLPVAPPRLVGLSLVDTVAERSHSYRALQPPSLTNQYAALPSLHFGWNLLVGIVLLATFTGLAVRIFAVAMPAAMAFSVVATANHFVLDVVLGIAVVLVGLALAALFAQRAPTLADSEHVEASRGRPAPVRDPVRRRPPPRQRSRPAAAGRVARRGARRG